MVACLFFFQYVGESFMNTCIIIINQYHIVLYTSIAFLEHM